MKILVIGNFSDTRCGFQNFSVQTATALQRAGHVVRAWDGTYSLVYARQNSPDHAHAFLPPDAPTYDVLHTIWHPATMNHYSGCVWPAGPILSVWNGCPAAWCPFTDRMTIRWGVLGTEPDHRQLFYPIPDWVDALPEPDPVFTVGYSGVRLEGVEALRQGCLARGWAMNFSDPTRWLTQEEEIRRLARSTINVCWYGAVHDDRSGSAMVCLASRRPLLTNTVRMFTHLEGFTDHYRADDVLGALDQVHDDWQAGRPLRRPEALLEAYNWTRAARALEEGWRSCGAH